VSATDDYKSLLRDRVGPALRSLGFKGSGSRWTLAAANGDRAIVNAQSSSGSSKAEVLFVINLAVVPLPWWDWKCTGFPKHLKSTPKEHDGLWRDRLHAQRGVFQRGSEAWWSVRDPASATICADDVVEQLASESVPRLSALLDRDNLAASARTGDLGFFRGEQHLLFFDHALAALIVDEGPSEELDVSAEPDRRRSREYRQANSPQTRPPFSASLESTPQTTAVVLHGAVRHLVKTRSES
jgi:hypothetical protein